jgi:hypothetical protein
LQPALTNRLTIFLSSGSGSKAEPRQLLDVGEIWRFASAIIRCAHLALDLFRKLQGKRLTCQNAQTPAPPVLPYA